MEIEALTPLCPPNATAISYTLIRHIGLILGELSSQGLELWQDERRRWHWRWLGAALQAERGFWALGEAVVDAVVTRYPAVFDSAAVLEGVRRSGWVAFGWYGISSKAAHPCVR